VAYENLLKSRRQVLHRRVGEALRDNVAADAQVEPELLAHHFTQAGLIETAIEWWGKAGQQLLERSALLEGVAQITRALDQIAILPATPALRREQIKLQVALIYPLTHVKGYAAPETKAAAERARLLIEQAEALGEPPEDPLLLFSVLYSFWVAKWPVFNGDALRELAAQILALAEKQGATVALVLGHRLMGTSLTALADFAEARVHFDRAMALYDSAAHRPLATRFGQDAGVTILTQRSLALWSLRYPEAALADASHASKNARALGQAATLLYALNFLPLTHFHCEDYATATALLDEGAVLAEEKGALHWKMNRMLTQSWISALNCKASDAVRILGSGITAWRSTGSTAFLPISLAFLARACVKSGQVGEAWHYVGEAMTLMETTKERWFEAEVHRIAGEIALKSQQPDVAKAQAYFERALAMAREQQAKSWELRAAMSMARLLHDQGKRDEARELLAPVHSWFTEGFDTRDLKEAKALLEELGA
jgi:predicted ATPase